MSNSIRLSPKYGVNPTIPRCFWCGELKNEIALMGKLGDGRKGEDIEAPKGVILDYEPCDKCKENFAKGVLLAEVTDHPNGEGQPPIQGNHYPTGRVCVVREEAAKEMFPTLGDNKKAFVDVDIMNQLQDMFNRAE